VQMTSPTPHMAQRLCAVSPDMAELFVVVNTSWDEPGLFMPLPCNMAKACHRPHRKHHFQHFLQCCVRTLLCYSCRLLHIYTSVA
jgi:hypothetical protein